MNAKVIGFVFVIAAVITAIGLHAVFNPFSKKRGILQDTPLMVRSIRGIGQLITAEYSGEVISTLHEEIERDSNNVGLNLKKRQIIAVGRGWVRAGIDFSAVTEMNFKYVPESKHIYLSGIKAEILYCDINPWFIPEMEIKGFEIIAATKASTQNDDLVIVKNGCLRRLREEASGHDIIGRARSNAEESLRMYFSILARQEIERVTVVW